MARKNEYQQVVREHYRQEAEVHGFAPTATMADVTTRAKEIAALLSHLKTGDRCLEVGCGNGAGSLQIARTKKLSMTCIDFSTDLIQLAMKQPKSGVKGKLRFRQQDVLDLEEKAVFDVVFTERCIINLLDWNDQKEALRRMARALRKGGRLLLLEAYKDGLETLNRARQELGLPAIPPAYHNLHLDRAAVTEFLNGENLDFKAEDNFLSSYYFGTRVLYPALARAGGRDVIYNSVFGSFFATLPPTGNYAHIKLLVFRKRTR
jgi:ubiquinone/menaquinone biosynthesis C-methylase UbiE